jgi:hypothetical protein
MTEKQTNVITVNNKEYNINEMNNTQQLIIAHLQDLDRKIANTRFALDQLSVGRDAFIQRLTTSLETPEEESSN